MAVVVFVKGEGFTKEMYEKVRKEVDWEHKHPQGGVFHAAAFEKSGNTIRIADVWESEADFNNFAKNQLHPVFEKYKMPTPKSEVFPAHNINAHAAIDKHKTK